MYRHAMRISPNASNHHLFSHSCNDGYRHNNLFSDTGIPVDKKGEKGLALRWFLLNRLERSNNPVFGVICLIIGYSFIIKKKSYAK